MICYASVLTIVAARLRTASFELIFRLVDHPGRHQLIVNRRSSLLRDIDLPFENCGPLVDFDD